MPTVVPKEPVVAALTRCGAASTSCSPGSTTTDWATPTCLPGWDVKAVVAHVIGTESMLLGDSRTGRGGRPADARTHVRNDIGRFNEAWVVARRRRGAGRRAGPVPRPTIAQRTAPLEATARRSGTTVGFTPGRAGHVRPVHAHPRVRLLAARAGHPRRRRSAGRRAGSGRRARRSTRWRSAMGYVVGKKAGAPQGSRVRFELTGPAARTHQRRGRRAGRRRRRAVGPADR